MPKKRYTEKILLEYEESVVGWMEIHLFEYESAFGVKEAQSLAAEVLEEAEEEFPAQEVRSHDRQ